MRKLYERFELLFAILWIVIYCAVSVPIRGTFGDESPEMLIWLSVIALGIIILVKSLHLERRYGLVKWNGNARDYLFFLPMLVLMTGNLWGGFGMAYTGKAQLFAVISMLLIGFIEELIFRGFLFRALLKKEPTPEAITISAVTFGIGHIVNLFAGKGGMETVIQVFFAIAWGFILTVVFYVSGSLWSCIVVHGLIDVFSKFSVLDSTLSYVYITVTIIISVVYCLYLIQKPAALKQERAK